MPSPATWAATTLPITPYGIKTASIFVHLTHGFTAELNHAGLQVHSGAEDWELSLQQWGRGDVLHPLPAAQMGELEANRAAFDRGVLVEWFLNGPLGLQHGWEIQQPPPGEGDQPLSLSFNQGGSLHAIVESSERALELTNSSGASSLNYSGLLAFDARGHELPAWFETLDDRVMVRVADAGAHYPITVDPWLQSAKLTAGDFSDQDQLGYSVAVSADGSTIVGAAPQSLAASDAPGVVYVYERPAAWASTPLYTARLTASDGVHADRLGSAVSISADGGTIAAGAEFNAAGGLQRGAVYIFTRPQTGWVDTVESAKLTASDGLDGDLLGRAVDLSHNGSTLVAGAHGADLVIGGSSRGAAYVFQRPSSGWETNTEIANLTASDAADYNWLGWFVAANEDGSLIAASAWGYDGAGGYNRGLVYLFERPAGGWVDATESARLTSSTTQDGRGLGYSLDMTLGRGHPRGRHLCRQRRASVPLRTT